MSAGFQGFALEASKPIHLIFVRDLQDRKRQDTQDGVLNLMNIKTLRSENPIAK